MSRFFLLLLTFLLTSTAPSCRQAEETREGTSPAPSEAALPGETSVDNRSRIQAAVLAVDSLDTHRFRLHLHVDSAGAVPGYANLAAEGDTITAYPNFVRREGSDVDYDDAANRQMLAARALRPGTPITAEVYQRGPESWLLMEWSLR